jgi:DNA polymerase elongation subunit (family B)
MKFYTNAYSTKNNIFVRGIEDGKPFAEKVNYKPYLFINNKTDEQTKYKDVHGTPVRRKDFESMSEAREYIKTYSDVDNMTIYGMTKFTYTYLNDAYRTIDYDPSQISVVGLDIETAKKAGGGFASAEVADAPITAITISRNGFKATFGYKDYVEHKENIKYYRCEDEEAMLRAFLTIWNSVEFCPDVVTGWNIEFYDIPFLVNRIERVLGEGASKKLSPWGIIKSYEQEIMGRVNKSYEIIGISNLDYMQVYKKFILSPRESYALDYICELELGVKKLSFDSIVSAYSLLEDNASSLVLVPDSKKFEDCENFEKAVLVKNKFDEEIARRGL